MDEVAIAIQDEKYWLWRASGTGAIRLIFWCNQRRNAKAAREFFGKLTAQLGQPRVAITDKLRSYIKPIRQLSPGTDHLAHKGLNSAIEVSHRPTRKREKICGRFKSIQHAQRFLSAHDPINLIFRPRRYQLTSTSYRHARADAHSLWRDYTVEMAA